MKDLKVITFPFNVANFFTKPKKIKYSHMNHHMFIYQNLRPLPNKWDFIQVYPIKQLIDYVNQD